MYEEEEERKKERTTKINKKYSDEATKDEGAANQILIILQRHSI
jgi:hypothetical protein